MAATTSKESIKIKKLADRYNMMANLFWSILNLLPISFFCYNLISPKLFYIFLAASLLTNFLPKSFFDAIQLGATPVSYKKFGINFINRFTQNGDIINVLIRKKYPQYKVVSLRPGSIANLLKQTYIFEKFHFMLFIFFILITIFAVVNTYLLWALVISITNIIYNVYPNLLQQYIRVKLKLAVRPK